MITNYSGSPSWSDASGTLRPPSPAPFSRGVSANTTTQVADPYRLDKITVDDASAGVESSSIAFSVLGPLDHFTFSSFPSVVAGKPFNLVVTTVDSAGNLLTGYAAPDLV